MTDFFWYREDLAVDGDASAGLVRTRKIMPTERLDAPTKPFPLTFPTASSTSVSIAPTPPQQAPASAFNDLPPAVIARDDQFQVTEGATIDGSVIANNTGPDSIRSPATTFITNFSGTAVPQNDGVTLVTARGGIAGLDSDGGFSFDARMGYDSLGAGQSVVETFTYTLTDNVGGIGPGTFAPAINLAAFTAADGVRILGAAANDFSGTAVSGLGDVNADGRNDVIIGAYLSGADDSGRATVLFGGAITGASLTLGGAGQLAIVGASANDLAGISVAGAGDVNDDGIDDILVGAYRMDFSGRTNAGATAVIYGAENLGGTINIGDIDALTGFVVRGAEENDYSGFSVSGAGDLNNDGIGDLIVGAWPADVGGTFEAGETFVVYGQPGRTRGPIDVTTLDGLTGFRIEGAALDDRSGFAVDALGDVNGDGIDDVIIGAIHADPGGRADAGSAYVLFGRTGSSPFSATFDIDDADFRIDGAAAGDRLGRAVSAAGDINSDGIGDLLVGAFQANGTTGQRDAGRAYVVFGGASLGGALDVGSLNGSNGFALIGVGADDWTGLAVSNVGDLNADGFDDIAIGAHLAGTDDAGAVYVVFGRDGGFGASIDLAQLNGTNGFTVRGAGPNAYLGFSVDGTGDLTGDGVDDMIVGSFGVNGNAGESYVIAGRGVVQPFSDTATIRVEIVGVNDAPVAIDDVGTVLESIGAVTGNVLTNDTDVDEGDVLTVTGVSGPNGSAAPGATLTLTNGTVIVGQDGAYTYTLTEAGLASGIIDSFSYTVSDGTVSDTATVTISYVDENNAPIAVSDTFSLTEDDISLSAARGLVSLPGANVLDNDTDADGDTLIVSERDGLASLVGVFVDSTFGLRTIIGVDGAVEATPLAAAQALGEGEIAEIVFNYTVSDGAATDVGQTIITLIGVNDAPMGGNDLFTIDEATPLDAALGSLPNILGNDTDIENDALSVVSVNGAAANVGASVTLASGAIVTLQGDGTLQYNPNGAFNALTAGQTATETISYGLSDGRAIASADIVITITGLDDSLFINAVDDSTATTADVPTTASLFDNDSTNTEGGFRLIDADFGGLASGTAVRITRNGQVTIDAQEGYGFLAAGETATDIFSYTIATAAIEARTIDAPALAAASAAIDVDGIVDQSRTGFAVAFIGDVNNDGVDDVAIGAPTLDAPGEPLAGGVYVLFGDEIAADGVIDLSEIGTVQGTGVFISGVVAGDLAGIDVSAAGDVDGDGVDDFLVAAPFSNNSGRTGNGAVSLVFGSSVLNTLTQFSAADATRTAFVVGASDQDRFGASVAAIGDFNGDGFDDALVGAPGTDDAYVSSGRAWVIFGDGQLAAGDTADLLTNNSAPTFHFYGYFSYGAVGESVAGAGDFNGDGFDDILFGAPNESSYVGGSDQVGAAYVIFGGSSGPTSLKITQLDGTNGIRLIGAAANGLVGADVAGLGDVNGDGIDDIAIAAPTGGPNGDGAVYVVYGSTTGFGGTTVNLESLESSQGFRIIDSDGAGLATFKVAAAGDVDSDGFADILVGTDGDADQDAVIVYGQTNSTATEVDLATTFGSTRTTRITNVGEAGGFAIAGGSDISGDGIDDVIIGAPGASMTGGAATGSGNAALIFGDVFFEQSVGLTDTADVALTITGVNDAPVARDDGYLLFLGTSVPTINENVLGNDTDVDNGAVLQVVSINNGAGSSNGTGVGETLTLTNGVLQIDANGALFYQYTSFGAAIGDVIETISYVVSDGTATDGGEIVLTLAGNSPPGAVDDAYAIDADSTSLIAFLGVTPNVLDNDTDADSDPLVVTDVDFSAANVGTPVTLASGAIITVLEDGSLEYNPNGAFGSLGDGEIFVETVNYSITDGFGFDDGLIEITVKGVGGGVSLPNAVDDAFDHSVDVGMPSIIDITANDDVPAGNRIISVNGVLGGIGDTFTLPSGARVTLDPNGDVIYDDNGQFTFLNPGSAVLDIFSYTLGGPSTDPGPMAIRGETGPRLIGQGSATVANFNERAGTSVHIAGDINGDGIDDYLIGAPGFRVGPDPDPSFPGAVYVIFGDNSGTVPTPDLDSLDGTNGFVFIGVDGGAEFGATVASADVNGDGLDDIIVGAPNADPTALSVNYYEYSGRAYVLYGRDTSFAAVEQASTLTTATGFSVQSTNTGAEIGSAIANAGDVNGDGAEDIIFGSAGFFGANGEGPGKAYVLFGSANGQSSPVVLETAVGDGIAFEVSPGPNNSTRLGASVSGDVDINGDGFDDVMIGAPLGGSTFYAGEAVVIFGATTTTLSGKTFLTPSLSAGEGFLVSSNNSYTYGSTGVSGIGDFNGDGIDDFAVGIPGVSVNGGINNGQVAVIFGGANLPSGVFDIAQLDGSNGFLLNGVGINEGGIGSPIVRGGDMNGDGFDDFAVLSEEVITGASARGTAYVLYGTSQAMPSSLDVFALNGVNGVTIFNDDGNGTGRLNMIGGGGDLNGDGNNDLLIADFLRDAGGTGQSRGEVLPIVDFLLGGPNTAEVAMTVSTMGPAPAPTMGDDFWLGGFAGEEVYGLDGDDTMRGEGGNDLLFGEAGADVILGGDGDDLLVGDSGVDVAALLASYGLGPSALPPLQPEADANDESVEDFAETVAADGETIVFDEGDTVVEDDGATVELDGPSDTVEQVSAEIFAEAVSAFMASIAASEFFSLELQSPEDELFGRRLLTDNPLFDNGLINPDDVYDEIGLFG